MFVQNQRDKVGPLHEASFTPCKEYQKNIFEKKQDVHRLHKLALVHLVCLNQ